MSSWTTRLPPRLTSSPPCGSSRTREGGFFRETFRAVEPHRDGARTAGVRHVDRVSAHGRRSESVPSTAVGRALGAPGGGAAGTVVLESGGGAYSVLLGPSGVDPHLATRPLARVPAHAWQAARVAPAAAAPQVAAPAVAAAPARPARRRTSGLVAGHVCRDPGLRVHRLRARSRRRAAGRLAAGRRSHRRTDLIWKGRCRRIVPLAAASYPWRGKRSPRRRRGAPTDPRRTDPLPVGQPDQRLRPRRPPARLGPAPRDRRLLSCFSSAPSCRWPQAVNIHHAVTMHHLATVLGVYSAWR